MHTEQAPAPADTTPAGSFPGREAAPSLRAESEAVLAATISGIAGGAVGLILGLLDLAETLWGAWSLAVWAGAAASIASAISSALGYWRSRTTDADSWRRHIANWRYIVSTASVVVAHCALTAIATLSIFAVLARSFIGLQVNGFWTTTLLALATGMAAWLSYLSASRMTTQHLTTLLVSFITIGTVAAMLTTSDPEWWKLHFSQLGTFGDLSSFLFNGTLIAGGLLVTTFTLYVANDLRAVGETRRGMRIVSTSLAIMGVMLALVGVFPVHINLVMHNLSASGMAAMFLLLLVGGPWIMTRMPRAYFLTSWAFLAALIASIVLFIVGYFGLTAFEIIVFALIFGWLAVFIRFLGVARQSD